MKKLYIKQKVFSIGEKFTVTDENDQPQYWVEGSFMRIPKEFTIYDRQGPFALITKKVFSLLPKFFVEINGQEVATISKELTFFKPRYTIEAQGIKVEGDWLDMDFDVSLQGQQIAAINKRWFAWGDTYEVAIVDSRYEHLVISLVIAIDCVKADEAAASSASN